MHLFAIILSFLFCALAVITHDPWTIVHSVYFGVLGFLASLFKLKKRIKESGRGQHQTRKEV